MRFRNSIFVLFIVSFNFSFAQKYFGVNGENFGKSILQKKKYNWKTIKSGNFEFNFYKGGESIAQNALLKAEREYSKITEILGYTPFTIMKVYIYNTQEDVAQSNLEIPNERSDELKLNNLSKSRIILYYTKNDSTFHNKLITEISTLFVQDMLYGGSLKEAMQSQIFLSVPDWYISGIAAYIAQQGQVVNQAAFKETILKYTNKKLSNIKGSDAQLLGHSIWYYIASRYGKDNISNILNLTRIIRNEQSSITSTLGVSFNRFLKEWKEFYINGGFTEKSNSVITDIPKIEQPPQKPLLNNLKSNEIDTDHYQFNEKNIANYKSQYNIESGNIGNDDKTLELINKPNRKSDEIKISAVKAYTNLLTTSGNQFSFLFDPVRGFCIGSGITFKDLLGNHVLKVNGYVKPTSPFFKNYDLDLTYGNYSRKIDYIFKFQKRSYNLEEINTSNGFLFRPIGILLPENKTLPFERRVLMQKASVEVVYPILRGLKLEAIPAFLKTTDFEYELPGRDNINEIYIYPTINLTYDNSRPVNNYIDLGTKAKFSFEKAINVSNQKLNFDRFNIDIRHYQRITRGLIAAGRINYTTSFGAAPKYSILGGTENWINRAIYNEPGLLPGKQGSFSDILFYNFPGQLRGFEFGRLFGNSHLLSNLEIRSMVSEYLPQSTLSSSFLSNLQLVAFYDIGTAWKGKKGPFSRQNSLNTIELGKDGISPFFAEVTNFRSPFLNGMGMGIRSSIMGYLAKVDYAVGQENNSFGKPRLYISIGRDF